MKWRLRRNRFRVHLNESVVGMDHGEATPPGQSAFASGDDLVVVSSQKTFENSEWSNGRSS